LNLSFHNRLLSIALFFAAVGLSACDDSTPQTDPGEDVVDAVPEVDDGDTDSSDELDGGDTVDMDDVDDGGDTEEITDAVDPVPVDCEAYSVEAGDDVEVFFELDAGVSGFQFTVFGDGFAPLVNTVGSPAEATLSNERLEKLFQQQERLSDNAISVLVSSRDSSSFEGQWSVEFAVPEAATNPEGCHQLLRAMAPGSDDATPLVELRVLVVTEELSFGESGPATDADLQRMIGSAATAMGALDSEVLVKDWKLASDDVAEDYSVVFSEADLDALVRRTELSQTRASVRQIPVILVDGFAGDFSSGGITVGRVGSIPGAPSVYSSDALGVVVSTEGVRNAADAEYLGKVLAHELGHFLGLVHTTETTGNEHDTLDDTGECGSVIRRDYTECPDADNLMFPYVRPNRTASASPTQRQIIRDNPFVGFVP
jgi:hypothetical protein